MSSTATIDLYRPYRTPPRQRVLRVLGELLFWLVILQLVTGLYIQSQLALFDGRIIVPNGIPKFLLVIAIVALASAVVLLQRGQIAMRRCMLPACIFACYLVADLAWLAAVSRLPIGALLFGFNKYFLFFAAIPAAALLRPRISTRQMNVRFVLLLLPLAALALAQYALNDPLLSVVSEDGSYEISALDFYGQTRAFSLFRSVLECGQGMAFFGALFLAQLVANQRHVLWNLFLLALAAAGCFVTFRRGAYLEFGAAALTALAICRQWSVSRWLPWMYLAVGIGLASAGTLISSSQSQGVLSSESLAERHGAWQNVLEKWLLSEDGSVLFGTGMAQTSLFGTGMAQIESEQVDYFEVDNGFLAVGAQLGLIGLALWCWVMHAMWQDMLATAWQTGSLLAIAAAALLSTWMMRAMFDPMFALYPLYAYLVFWSGHDAARASRVPSRARQVVVCA
jgi:hypothetical protein